MENFDKKNNEIMQDATLVVESFAGEDKDEAIKQMQQFAVNLQNRILADAREVGDTQDEAVLASRGVRQLTRKEKEYYQRAAEAMRDRSPKQALTNLDIVLPETVIDRVFEDIATNHPILSAITYTNTGALVKIITSSMTGTAGWGELCAEIVDEVGAGFDAIEMVLKKLSAFMPVCIAMLDLGPAWLDRYVRTVLSEALATALEAGIVDGDGNNKPLGMTRALSGDSGGVFPRKTAVTVTDLSPESIGAILDTLSQTPNGNRRAVNRLLMVVNPSDYFTKVFPAITPRTANGTFAENVMPFPTTVVQSPAVPAGNAVFGIAGRYFMALGTGEGGRIEFSDEFKFLDDFRYYKVKLYGNGRPLDENAFILADISSLKTTAYPVTVVNAADFPTA